MREIKYKSLGIRSLCLIIVLVSGLLALIFAHSADFVIRAVSTAGLGLLVVLVVIEIFFQYKNLKPKYFLDNNYFIKKTRKRTMMYQLPSDVRGMEMSTGILMLFLENSDSKITLMPSAFREHELVNEFINKYMEFITVNESGIPSPTSIEELEKEEKKPTQISTKGFIGLVAYLLVGFPFLIGTWLVIERAVGQMVGDIIAQISGIVFILGFIWLLFRVIATSNKSWAGFKKYSNKTVDTTSVTPRSTEVESR